MPKSKVKPKGKAKKATPTAKKTTPAKRVAKGKKLLDKVDPKWVEKMAAVENNGVTSVGGLTHASTTPAERPANYQRIHMPTGKCPIDFDGDPKNTFEVLQWAEALRDEYEKQRVVPSQAGMMVLARTQGVPHLVDTVRDLYANEPSPARPRSVQLQYFQVGDRFNDGVRNCQVVERAGEGSEVKVYVVTGPDAGKTLRWARTAEVFVGQLPHVPTNVPKRAQPSQNGAPPATTNRVAKERAPKPARTMDAPVKVDNKTDIPVEWTGSGGRFRCTILGESMRGVIRWLGWKGYSVEQVTALMDKLGLAGYPEMKAIVAGHVKSGSRGKEGCYGAPAVLTEEQGKLLKKHLNQ